MVSRIQGGIPTIRQYDEIRTSSLFAEMDGFCEHFLQMNTDILVERAGNWQARPIHWCTRQWEYPFLYAGILEFVSSRPAGARTRILDAGCGVTFVPYFLASTVAGAEIKCCDCDPALDEVFSVLGRRPLPPVEFRRADLHDLPYEDGSIDILYCISVLEHTGDYEPIAREFKRVLADGGALVLTFDICMRGDYQIAPAEAGKLLDCLHSHFPGHDCRYPYPLKSLLASPDILTTNHVRRYRPDICPALPPFTRRMLSSAKGLLYRRKWKRWSYNITCFGDMYRKSPVPVEPASAAGYRSNGNLTQRRPGGRSSC